MVPVFSKIGGAVEEDVSLLVVSQHGKYQSKVGRDM
jgi:hypothetical protein